MIIHFFAIGRSWCPVHTKPNSFCESPAISATVFNRRVAIKTKKNKDTLMDLAGLSAKVIDEVRKKHLHAHSSTWVTAALHGFAPSPVSCFLT